MVRSASRGVICVTIPGDLLHPMVIGAPYITDIEFKQDQFVPEVAICDSVNLNEVTKCHVINIRQ